MSETTQTSLCPILNVDAVIDGTDDDSAPSIWLSDRGLANGVVVPKLGATLDENVEDGDSAVVIYTSGSTGNVSTCIQFHILLPLLFCSSHFVVHSV